MQILQGGRTNLLDRSDESSTVHRWAGKHVVSGAVIAVVVVIVSILLWLGPAGISNLVTPPGARVGVELMDQELENAHNLSRAHVEENAPALLRLLDEAREAGAAGTSDDAEVDQICAYLEPITSACGGKLYFEGRYYLATAAIG